MQYFSRTRSTGRVVIAALSLVSLTSCAEDRTEKSEYDEPIAADEAENLAQIWVDIGIEADRALCYAYAFGNSGLRKMETIGEVAEAQTNMTEDELAGIALCNDELVPPIEQTSPTDG